MASLFSDISNFVNNQLGLSTSTGFGQTTVDQPGLVPWRGDESIYNEEAFWKPMSIDGKRWNKLYPYRLLVVDVSKPGKPRIVSSSSDFSARSTTTILTPERGSTGLEYVISQQVLTGSWEITLPITPQQLKITDQFAINTSATMRGIVEEHNGVKFKTITASGTTGIWPLKPTQGGKIASPTSLGSIAGGTLEAFSGLAQSVGNVASMATSGHPNRTSSATKPEDSAQGEFATGYYQALYLGQFFERYAQAKKNPKNKGWRLVFDMPKQNQSFIVTPVAFESAQSEQKPNQYMFSFQLKAWKRINLQDDSKAIGGEIPSLDANLFQRIVRTIAATRKALGNAKNLVKAVRSDAQQVFNVLRQTSLAVKDTAGLAVAVGDLPKQVVQDLQSTVQEAFINIKDVFPVSGFSAAGSSNTALANPNSNKVSTSSGDAGSIVDYANKSQKINEGLSSDQIAAGALGSEAAARQDTDPMKEVFANPETNFDLFDSINLDDVTLTLPQQLAIEEELLNVRSLTIDDFRAFKQALVNLSHDIADNFGAGNETYSKIYGFPDPKTRAIPMTVEENELLQSIFESVQAYDLLTSTKQYDDLTIESAMDFVGGLANESGIDFEDFSSKLLAPVPFGATIEEIAARYMGDSSKWLEIVTLNKLRSPYIDETGFTYPLLSNAEGRQFNVDDTEDNLFVGQKITIVSDTQPPIIRKIINVEKIGDGNYLVTVDGLDNLSLFETSDNARMQGYLPGTVNSQNQIYIPINAPSDPDDRTFSVVNVPDTALNKLAKIDFLLTDNFDVAINSTGDFRLASGLTNLIQALKLKIRTQKGSILRHLDYGIGLQHGISVADIENGAIIKSLNAMIASDSRFESIDSITIRLNGATMLIDMSVRIANGSGILPISFDIRAA
jgi:hypothetical protein